MTVEELIKRLQDMPQDAEVLQNVAFGRYHTTESTYFHKKENKVSLSGWLWEGDRK